MRFPCLFMLTAAASTAAASGVASLSEIVTKAFQSHLDARDIAGVAVAVVAEDKAEYFFLGKAQLEPEAPVGPETRFEIGSITKVLTGTLLAMAVQEGGVTLATPVQDLLPAGVQLAALQRPITLLDLATHSSGLPRMPDNLRPANEANPYADYCAENLLDFVRAYQPRRAPGLEYEYSNLATALLGYALAQKAGKPYRELLDERLLGPLGMTSALASAPAGTAQGHTGRSRFLRGKELLKAGNWDFDVFLAAGGVRANIEDMARFLRACMAPPATPLGEALRDAQQPRFKVNETLSVGLNWHILALPGAPPITWHNGQTGGFHSFLGFDPETQQGIVALANTDYDIDPACWGVLKALREAQ